MIAECDQDGESDRCGVLEGGRSRLKRRAIAFEFLEGMRSRFKGKGAMAEIEAIL